MGMIPAALLRRLYRRGSLRNWEEGFQLALHNTLAPSVIVAVGPLEVDGTVYEPSCIRVLGRREPRPASRINARAPINFPINSTLHLQVVAAPLPAGEHRLTLTFETKELGQLVLETTDRLNSVEVK